MAKIDHGGGTAYQAPVECWEPTMHLAFFAALEDQAQSSSGGGVPSNIPQQVVVQVLHQQWRSNIGRTAWRRVPEMDPTSRDNE